MADAPETDPYARVEYRRLVAWPERIRREAPFLVALLEDAPEASVLDLGCGTGEHVAFFAGRGARAVGIDSSPSMIERAREHERQGRGRFLLGDVLEAGAVLGDEPPFGLALCLGNMLPHLEEASQVDALIRELGAVLLPGGAFLLQILNYQRILEQGMRHLPLNFREGDGGKELVFVRLMKPAPDGRVLFFPTTLELDPDAEEPVTLKATRRVRLRAWTARDLVPRFEERGFSVQLFGDLEGGPYDAARSNDLVLVARRGGRGRREGGA